MAKVTYSALVGGITGSIGGVTFRGAGSSGIVSARARGPRVFSLAQERQQNLIGEARRDYAGLAALDRACFDFSVSEGYFFRRESGGRFSSPRAAYSAWYAAGRYMGASIDVYKTVALHRRYGAALAIQATGVAGKTPSFKLYFGSPYAYGPYAVWMAPAKSMASVPARPVWKLVYSAGFDPHIARSNSGLPAPFQYCIDIGEYVALRVPYFEQGAVIAYRYCGPCAGDGFGTGGPLLMQL